jgi:hypothetical protein
MVVGGWASKISTAPENEEVDLATRSEGGSEQVAVEISFVSSSKMIAGVN